MTDETREQIKRDADEWTNKIFGYPYRKHPESVQAWNDDNTCFIAGATHQHPISYEAGKNEGIDLCISRMKELFKIIANGEQNFVLKELEALKTEKV